MITSRACASTVVLPALQTRYGLVSTPAFRSPCSLPACWGAPWRRSSSIASAYHRSWLLLRAGRHSDPVEISSESAEPSMSEGPPVSNQTLLTGQLCLCGVAILWGSYSPVVRYIYSGSGPPTPAALTAVRTVIQAAVLLVSDLIIRQHQHDSPQKAKLRRLSSTFNLSSRQSEGMPPAVQSTLNLLSHALRSTSGRLWVAGAELGFWNFCGSTFQALGLQYTAATRGAFLIQVSQSFVSIALTQQILHIICWWVLGMQATSLLTPVMATLAGEKPSRGVWLGCVCTLAGTVLITLDHSATSGSALGTPASLGNRCFV